MLDEDSSPNPLTTYARANLQALEEATNQAVSLREALVDDVLEAGGVSQQPTLKLVRH